MHEVVQNLYFLLFLHSTIKDVNVDPLVEELVRMNETHNLHKACIKTQANGLLNDIYHVKLYIL